LIKFRSREIERERDEQGAGQRDTEEEKEGKRERKTGIERRTCREKNKTGNVV